MIRIFAAFPNHASAAVSTRFPFSAMAWISVEGGNDVENMHGLDLYCGAAAIAPRALVASSTSCGLAAGRAFEG